MRSKEDQTKRGDVVHYVDAGERPSDAESREKDCSRQQGFTLLEVMIALAIVGTTLIAMLSLGNRTIDSSDQQQKLTQATLLAQEKMTELERTAGARGNLSLVETNGVFSEPFTAFSWKIDFSPTPVPQVQQVVVSVSWGKDGQNELVDLTSFVFQ